MAIQINTKMSYFKLLAACLYELMLLTALWFIAALLFIAIFGDASHSPKRYGLQFFLWFITGAYFVWCWRKSGQTLATQTWKIKLVNQAGGSLNVTDAIIRYILSSLSVLAFGIGFMWALVDRDRLFLHDRLLKTRFILVAKS